MTDMPPEALSSMPPPSTIVPKEEVQFSFTAPTPKPTINPTTGQPVTRGRGRPPGARNKVKEAPGGTNPPMRINNKDSAPRQPRPTDPVDKPEAIKEEKKARAAQYSSFIVDELNDKLFMLIIGATAIPAEAIFKEGRVPPKAQTNPHLTEFGNAIAIPADVADSWGKLIAEITYTPMGKGLVKAGTNPNTGIAIAAIAAIFSTYRYVQQLKPVLDLLKQTAAKSQETNNEGTAT